MRKVLPFDPCADTAGAGVEHTCRFSSFWLGWPGLVMMVTESDLCVRVPYEGV